MSLLTKDCASCAFAAVGRDTTVCQTCDAGTAYRNWKPKTPVTKAESPEPVIFTPGAITWLPEGVDPGGLLHPPALGALETQVGGGHYKKFAIQPAEFIEKNGLSFLEGCVVKRICRWKNKDGLQDLLKIKHEIDLLIAIHRLE